MSAATLPRASNAGVIVGLVGLLITGGFVVAQLMAQGHAAYNASSVGLMWGLPIVTYDFLLMSSCGAALVASMWTVFGSNDYAPVARRALWLALALLIGGVAALFLELGAPLRALYAIPLNLQVKAPLFWKVIAVAVYALCLLLMVASWIAKPAGDTKPSSGIAAIGALAALAVVFTGALMFATLSMRPFWHSGEVPVMILVEAVLGGLALTLLFTHLAGNADDATRAAIGGPLPRAVALLTFVTLLFVIGRAVVGLASNLDGLQVWSRVVGSAAFWVQLACLVVALWLTASASMRGNGGMQTLAMLLLIVGLFIGKYEFVVGGQLVPLFKGSWVHGLIQYTPSVAEWALLAMAAFLAYAVYAFGAARFRLGGR
jgi:molybdopterin-containing oxidoreductase family membrane subunit